MSKFMIYLETERLILRDYTAIDYEWHDGKMKTRLEYRLLRKEFLYSKDRTEERE